VLQYRELSCVHSDDHAIAMLLAVYNVEQYNEYRLRLVEDVAQQHSTALLAIARSNC
jgi:hypothetical protein